LNEIIILAKNSLKEKQREKIIFCFSIIYSRMLAQTFVSSGNSVYVYMGKDNTKNLVGQPILKQIVKILPEGWKDLQNKISVR
jgi:hypothetical protein